MSDDEDGFQLYLKGVCYTSILYISTHGYPTLGSPAYVHSDWIQNGASRLCIDQNSGGLCKSNAQAVASVHAFLTPCNAEQGLIAGVADLIRVGKSMGCLVTSLLKVPCLDPCTPCFPH